MSAALRENGVKYNKFINLLKVKKIKVDRKIWAQIALEHPEVFDNAVKKVQQ
jgi:ribosomal protein L20